MIVEEAHQAIGGMAGETVDYASLKMLKEACTSTVFALITGTILQNSPAGPALCSSFTYNKYPLILTHFAPVRHYTMHRVRQNADTGRSISWRMLRCRVGRA